MAEGLHNITKIVLLVISAFLAISVSFDLLSWVFGTGIDFGNIDHIIRFIRLIVTIIVSVLVFIGALLENPSLLSLAIGVAVLILLSIGYRLFICLTNEGLTNYFISKIFIYIYVLNIFQVIVMPRSMDGWLPIPLRW